jgi:uncharacterized protein
MAKTPIRIEKKTIKNFCKKHHIIYLALFGSALGSHFTKDSDVDILIRFDRKHIPHLFDLIAMESELSELLGYTIDLKTPNDLSPYFREEVVNTAKVIYGK